jgi:hypothetical protein
MLWLWRSGITVTGAEGGKPQTDGEVVGPIGLHLWLGVGGEVGAD